MTDIERLFGREVKVRSRIKSWESVWEKIKRFSFPQVADLQDLVGIRIVVGNGEERDQISDVIHSAFFVTSRSTHILQRDESVTHLVTRNTASLTEGVAAEIE